MQIVEIGLAEGLVNPVLVEVNKAMVPLRANSKPAKCKAEAVAMKSIDCIRAKLLGVVRTMDFVSVRRKTSGRRLSVKVFIRLVVLAVSLTFTTVVAVDVTVSVDVGIHILDCRYCCWWW
jgi:hypothetical protein